MGVFEKRSGHHYRQWRNGVGSSTAIELLFWLMTSRHWVSPYSTLRAANVESTRYLIELAAEGKHKQVTFVSSTSTLGTDHFVQLSRSLVSSEGTGILESDDLQGSMKGLDTGYGQTKWVSEYLMREAGRRGLVGCIVRPAYVLGDSNSGGEQNNTQV